MVRELKDDERDIEHPVFSQRSLITIKENLLSVELDFGNFAF